MRLRTLVVFASGNGSNFQAIAETIAREGWPIRIAALFTDRPRARCVRRAQFLGIPVHAFSSRTHPDRETLFRAMAEHLDRLEPLDLLVLAGFMKILPPWFVRRWEGKIVNIHPSLLPAYPGLHAIRRAWENREPFTGVTVHLVDEGVDTGPVLAQARVEIREGEPLHALEERVHQVEHHLYPRVIAQLLGILSREPLSPSVSFP